MGRVPCCEKDNVKRGQWTPEEDNKLSSYIAQHGTRNWRLIPKNAGLQRCGKSCRLRWTNYLRPDLKHGEFSEAEEQTIMRLHAVVGNRWSLIAAQLPGRTDNDIKNYWNTKLKKKLSGMGIDPVTHKPFSHLMAEIATTLPPPHVSHLAEAALGCFKDEMLHLLTKKRLDFQLHQPIEPSLGANTSSPYNTTGMKDEKQDNTVEKIKLSLSRAIQEHNDTILPVPQSKSWDTAGMASSGNLIGSSSSFPEPEFQYAPISFKNEGDASPWTRSLCGESSLAGRLEDENGEESEVGKDERMMNGSNCLFNSDCVVWDLPSDDLMDPIV